MHASRFRRMKNRIRRLLFVVASLGVGVVLCMGATVVGIWVYCRTQPLPPIPMEQTSILYDMRGDVIETSFRLENRRVVSLEQVAPSFKEALLSIEDQRFYRHLGIDVLGLVRAVWVNLTQGEIKQGASTLTQQLARNAYLSHERSLRRKLKESLYALQLEAHYTKDEIVTLYMNKVYFGYGAYGVEAASTLYFGKSARSLTLAESALLAGVVRSWKYYSPYENLTRCRTRQQLILDTMKQQGRITHAQWTTARQLMPTLLPPPTTHQASRAPYFGDYVRELATKQLGIDATLYDTGGLAIYTTLDLRTQRIAEETISAQLHPFASLQGALIALDPRNGHIRAMVGGRNYAENQYNRTLATSRQPGSSFKPIVYLTALSQPRFVPTTTFRSEPTVFTYDNGRHTYAPRNYANKYHYGLIDMRQAIARSDNIYAVHTLMEIGTSAVIKTARQLGIKAPLTSLPSLALGSSPISPFEMATAYATIANHGMHTKPQAILRIVDAQGNTQYTANPPLNMPMVDERAAYVLTNMLQGVFAQGGTAWRVTEMIKRPVAGKTGTTNRDAWMVGYTPELATAVWVGYDQGRLLGTLEAHTALPIFAAFTERVLQAVPPKPFVAPQGVVSVYIDEQTGLLGTGDCPQQRLETFIVHTAPTAFCTTKNDPPKLPLPTPPQKAQEERKKMWWNDVLRWWRNDALDPSR
jgi:1A family penicillin-binding protein